MWQKEQKYSPIVNLALLLVLASTPIAAILVSQFAVAQTEETKQPSFPLPKSIESNTIVRIDGSSSMARINESLKQSFEQQFSGAKVELATNGADAAIKSVLDGKTDLAAIGRGLTQAELAQGLQQKRLRREKIAIVVGENNPFEGNITNQQFAKMFRGEITNWSQVGGANGKIRFIDRPEQSETREALRNYPAFKAAKFATGANATQISTDDSVELVKQLGNDGIGYVIANQVSKVPGLRVLKLHQTLPNDARYPFSQPLVYAYKENPSPGVAGFLGFAGAEPGTIAVEAARSAEAAAIAQSVASGQGITASTATPTPASATTTVATSTPVVTETPTPTDTTTTTTDTPQANPDTTDAALPLNATTSGNTETSAFPWWLLLPLAALGAGILWWLLGKGNKRSEALEGASALPITGAPVNDVLPKTTTLQGNTPTTINSVDGVDNIDSNVSNIPGAALGGAALAGAATGIGLWPRLADGDIEAPSEDISQPQVDVNNPSDISVDAEPVAVVMPTHPEVPNLPQVDSSPVIDVVPNTEEAISDNSNWLDSLNAASGVAAIGGVTAGAGLWSSLANRNNNESTELTNMEVEPELTASNEDVTVAGTPSIEQTEATVDLPISNQQPLPDVWEDTEQEPTSQQINVLVEPDALENADASEVIETISISPASTSLNTPDNQIALETNATDEQLADVLPDDSQPASQSSSNWLDNIRDAGAGTLASGAAIAGGATAIGAGLWSSFANSGNDHEPTNETDEPIVDTTQEVLATEVYIPEVIQPNIVEPTTEVYIPEVTQPNIVEPTTEIDIPEVTQPNIVEPTAEIDTLEDQTSLVDAAIEEQLPDVWQDNSQPESQSGSNWLDNIRDAGAGTLAGGAAIAGGAAAIGAGLWSSFANSGNDHEPIETNDLANTNEQIVETTQEVLATEVYISEVTQPNIVEPTTEVYIPEVTQPNIVEPTTEVYIPEVTQPNIVEPTVEVDIPEVIQSNIVEPTVEVDIPEVIQSNIVEPTAEIDTFEEQTLLVDAATDEQLPDVWEDNSQPVEQNDSNWLDNIRDAGASTLASGAAIAGGAAVGAGLWSSFANSGNDHEPTNETDETNEPIVETTQEVLATEVDIPEVIQPSLVEPTVEIDIPEVSQSNIVEPTAEIDTFEEQTLLVDAATDEQLPDVWEDNSQPVEQNGSNWLDNIRDAGTGTLASGAAIAGGATAVGAGLWSSFANSGNDHEPTNETDETNEPIVETTQEVLATEVDIPEVTQPSLIEPTAEVYIPEVIQPSLLESTTNEEVINAQEVDFEQTPESDSNWLRSVAEEGAVVAEGAAVLESGWLSSRSTDENQSNKSNKENLEVSESTGISSDATEVPEAEIFSVHEVVDTNATQIDIPDVLSDTNIPVVNTEPVSTPEFNINPALAGGAAVVIAGAVLGANLNHEDNTDTDVAYETPVIDTTPVAPSTNESAKVVDSSITNTVNSNINSTKSHISFTARTPKWAYIAWNIDEQDKQALSKDGAAQLALRLYDTTDTDLSYQTPQLVQQYECEEAIEDRFVAIPASDRDYMAEIGYLTIDNQWLSISRSPIVRVFSRPHQEFWFEADAELIIHGATEPGSNVIIGGQSVKLKPDGTFHLRIPFTEELIDYVMTAVAKNGEKAKTIHMHFEQNDK